jgi:hypothetical protein
MLALAMWSHGASAASPTEAARAYFDAGTQAYQAGQYLVALRAYESAHAALPSPETVFSIAQAARLAFFEVRDPELLRHARDHYRRYLDDAPAGRRRAHAVQHLAAVEAMLALAQPAPDDPYAEDAEIEARAKREATVLLVVSRTPGARARIDGGPLEALPLSREVTPGNHRVEVVADGYATDRSDWPALDGRLVVAPVSLRPLPSSLRVSAPGGAQLFIDGRFYGEARSARLIPGRHTVRVTARGHELFEQVVDAAPGQELALDAPLTLSDWRLASYWLFGGAGALALGAGVGAVVALVSERQALDLEESIGRVPLSEPDRRTHEGAADTRDAARTAAVALGIAAAGVAGAGVVIYFADAPEAAPEHGLVVTPQGLSWRMSF